MARRLVLVICALIMSISAATKLSTLPVSTSDVEAQAGPPCFPPPSGMVSWWPGDGSPSDVAGSNSGSLSGPVSFVPGEVGMAFNFDGSDYVTIPSNASLEPAQLTIDAWVKPVFAGRPADTADVDTVLTKIDAGGGINGYELSVVMDPTFTGYLQDGGGTFPMGTPVFFLDINGSGNQIFGATPMPNDGAYHLLAATYDGTTMQLFLDGVQTAMRTAGGTIVHSAAPAFIGYVPVSPRRSRASIDEVEIFDRALSSTEIQSIFNAGSRGKCKSAQTSASLPLPS